VSELRGGLNGAIVSLGVALPLGVIALAPLGVDHVGAGIRAALVSAIVGNAVASVVGGIRFPNSGPRAAVTLIYAAFIASLIGALPAAARTAGAIEGALFLGAVSVVGAGLLQTLFGLLRLGGLVKFVPFPVVAGFMNGVAILIVLSQLPALLGVTAINWRTLASAGDDMQPAAAIVGAATALCIVVVARRWRNAPAYLIGLACGTALWFAMDAGMPAVEVGSLAGAIPGSLGLPSLAPETAVALLREHGGRVLTTSLVIAVVGAMDTLLAAVAVDSATVERHDSNRVLRGQGLANVVAGALGGTPVSYSTAIALATARAGGRGALAAILGSVALLVAVIVGRPLLAMLPLAALAGVMLAVAASLTDRWTRVVARQALAGHANAETAWGLAVVVLVCAVTVAFGFIAAVAAGVIVSMALFIGAMNRSLVRTRATAATRASRRSYPPEATRFLRTHGERIRTLDLEGALFFGTAERLAIEIEPLAATARFVVLDLRRVTTIDASGAVILERLWRQLARRGVDLLLGGVGAGERHGVALLACGTFTDAATRPWYATSDEALEHAERTLLAEAGGIAAAARVAIEDVALMQGLDDAARRSLVAHLVRLEVPAGTLLFRAGDPGDRLYVLTEGSVSIRYRSADRDHRLITCAPGVVFGEIALLDGAGRSADAVADDDSVVYELTQAQLDDIRAREPALAAQLLLNIARQLSVYLRFASANLREADR
jgi:SulP family sulfate permease